MSATPTSAQVLAGATLLLLWIALFFDWRSRKIPNALSLPALLLGLAAASYLGGSRGLLLAAIGAAGSALVPLLVYLFGAIGGGDVKLLAAVGALAGLRPALEIQLWAYFLILAFVSLRLTWRGELWAALRRAVGRAGKPRERGDPARSEIPLAGALLLGGLLTLLGELLPF